MPSTPGTARISDERVAEIVAEANAYEAAHPEARISEVWQDVIQNFPEYDEKATDPDDYNDAFSLTDGTVIYWEGPGGPGWCVAKRPGS